MLVLTREPGQSIVVGENAEIRVKILTNDGEQVRIGIEAPRNVPVQREERYLRIQKNRTVDHSSQEATVPCIE